MRCLDCDSRLPIKLPAINPELLSDKPTHRHRGVLVKVFRLGMTPSYDSPNPATRRRLHTAEIMEGESKGKMTTVYDDELRAVLTLV